MFLRNKYTKQYYKIINKARAEIRLKKGIIYYESHHIIPKCLGGTNNKQNLVLLTGKEHFICHHLLIYMVKDDKKYKMKYAFNAMRRTNSKNREKLTPSQFETLRKNSSILMKEKMEGREFSDEHKLNISKALKEGYESGSIKLWYEGRPEDFEAAKEKRVKSWKENYTEEKSLANSKRMKDYWSDKDHPMKGKIGINHPDYGKNKSEENKQKAIDGFKNMEKIICFHCDKKFHPTTYKRYHGDKCLKNPERDKTINFNSITSAANAKKMCEYCEKMVNLGNYARFHGKNCKLYNLTVDNPDLKI